MAGGPNARVVPCMHCFARAERVSEGLENDGYRCEAGHTFGIDWAYDGPPARPQWPPTEEARAAFDMLRRVRGR